ncbi:membrane protein [Paractinoplanes deccanensis]|uniref:Membrane protein n=1 Tax=Paractinoplanes deccanensis TaxID=113561 RepID=A0ABQ3XVN2_9ACTN|nr:glycosyltransferase family 87 protein [Actinoplanes deccanensis]GID71804.1 membrane protein [Actinoplanes deccanensis]
MQPANGTVPAALAKIAPWPAVVVAYAIFAQQVWRIAVTFWALDNNLIVDAVRNLQTGHSPYESKRFLYPPSSIPFALVQTPFTDHTLMRTIPYVLAVGVLVAWWAALKTFGFSMRSWLGIAGVAIVAVFEPVNLVLVNANWTAIVAALMSVALLLMSRNRWLLAGVAVGVSIAIKPMLVPLGLVFLLARRWGGFAAAAGIPVVLSGIVMALLPDPGLFFTKTVPFLLNGQDDFSKPYDSSLIAVLPRIGIDGPVVTVLRAVVLIVAITVAVLRWRQGGEERLRIVETSSALLLGTFLVLSPAFMYYPLLVIPMLVASIAVPGSIARSLWFWLASLLLIATVVRIYGLDFPTRKPALRESFKGTAWITIAGLMLVIKVVAGLRKPPPSPAPRGLDDDRRPEPAVAA